MSNGKHPAVSSLPLAPIPALAVRPRTDQPRTHWWSWNSRSDCHARVVSALVRSAPTVTTRAWLAAGDSCKAGKRVPATLLWLHTWLAALTRLASTLESKSLLLCWLGLRSCCSFPTRRSRKRFRSCLANITLNCPKSVRNRSFKVEEVLDRSQHPTKRCAQTMHNVRFVIALPTSAGSRCRHWHTWLRNSRLQCPLCLTFGDGTLNNRRLPCLLGFDCRRVFSLAGNDFPEIALAERTGHSCLLVLFEVLLSAWPRLSIAPTQPADTAHRRNSSANRLSGARSTEALRALRI